jgi:hypothetical protein
MGPWGFTSLFYHPDAVSERVKSEQRKEPNGSEPLGS